MNGTPKHDKGNYSQKHRDPYCRACNGYLFTPGAERHVYKTSDGTVHVHPKSYTPRRKRHAEAK